MDVDMHPSPQVRIMGRGGGIGRRFIDLDPEAVLLKRIHALEFSANSCETWAQSTFGDPVRSTQLRSGPPRDYRSVVAATAERFASSCSRHPGILPLIWLLRHYGEARTIISERHEACQRHKAAKA